MVDDCGLVLKRLPARQSLHPQIAVHAVLLKLLGVLHYCIELGCALPVPLQLIALRDAECFSLEFSALLLCLILGLSEIHRQLVGIAPC
jgi:hypothetical protein